MNVIKANLKDFIFFLLSFIRGSMSHRASLLMYHSISESDEYFFNVTPLRFEEQMRFLSEHGFRVISLHELLYRLKERQALNGEIVITFDDGFKDNMLNAFPILQKYQFPATIFVTTDLIGKTDNRGLAMLTSSDLVFLSETGLVDIAPHTKSHPKLSKLTSNETQDEILGSKKTLEQIIGKTCYTFAYPFGNFNSETVSEARKSGFDGAITVKEGTVTFGEDLFTLRRNSIDRSTSMIQFQGKLSRVIDRYEFVKKIFHGHFF